MHIALGYRWFVTTTGYHLERAFHDLGHTVTYVGLPCSQRSGYDSASPINEIIASLPHRPDVYLWIDSAGRYFPRGIENLSIPAVCYLIDVHLGSWRQHVARFFDAVFIAQKDYVETFRRSLGHNQVYWLPLAAAPDVHQEVDLPRIYEVGFAGNIAQAHTKTARARRLKLIAGRFRTNDFYRSYPPEEVGRVYSQSLIVFNTSISGDVTMRIFEGAACGALVLTDSTANGLSELFEVGSEIVTYTNDTDLMDMLSYFLTHEEEREAIARAGHHRVLSEHTYHHRVARILETVTSLGFRQLAPMRQSDEHARLAARRIIYTHLHMIDAVLDDLRDAGAGLLTRAWSVLPVLVRRFMR